MAVVEVCDTPAKRVASLVQDVAQAAIVARGAFSIAIAGGSLVKMLGEMREMSDVQWDKWYVAWVDERCVPHSDQESNYRGAREAWLSKVEIPSNQVFPIKEELCTEEKKVELGGGGMAQAAAEEYEARLRGLPESALPRTPQGLPAFDLLLLGFGPDGHVCSLFPGHSLLSGESAKADPPKWILSLADSPKLPPERITLSMEAVNAAAEVVLVGVGDGKKEIVKQALSAESQLPCSLVRGAGGRPTWVLDDAAATLLEVTEASTFEVRRIGADGKPSS